MHSPWFTQDGQQSWGYEDPRPFGWAVVKNSESNTTELKSIDSEEPPEGSPWKSSCGYQAIDDEWILNSSTKQFLWLPPQWQLTEEHRKWNGQFLAIFHHELPRAVILELFK